MFGLRVSARAVALFQVFGLMKRRSIHVCCVGRESQDLRAFRESADSSSISNTIAHILTYFKNSRGEWI
jgi:hypothetical protein